jgi:hypothetical protein
VGEPIWAKPFLEIFIMITLSKQVSIFFFSFLSVLPACLEQSRTQTDATVKIVNGKEIERVDDDYPGVVQLITESDGELGRCTGSFIRPSIVLTAAHCVDQDGAVVYLTKQKLDGSVSVRSKDIALHPEWEPELEIEIEDLSYDLALVYFDLDIAANTEVRQITDELVNVGDQATMVGYGRNIYDNMTSAGKKRLGYNAIYDVSQDRGLFALVGWGESLDATGENASVAKGDSGGPLFIGGKIAGVASATLYGVPQDSNNTSVYVDLNSKSSQDFLLNNLSP